MLKLASCSFIREHLNVFITGPTGAGKTYLSCALGNKADFHDHQPEHRRARQKVSASIV